MFKKNEVYYYANMGKTRKVLVAEDQASKDVVHSPLESLLVCNPKNKKDRYYVSLSQLYCKKENAVERVRLEKALKDLKTKDILDDLMRFV